MVDIYPALYEIFPDIITTLSVSVALGSILFAIGGAINFALRGKGEISPSDISSEGQIPFERSVLAKYYNQALNAANISFWFSLIFAAAGFGVIIVAFITYSQDDAVGAVIKIASGVVIDLVSGLFFVQSQNSRKSMADFFEKLRLDRLSAEAREMIEQIEDTAARDQLRMQLVMKFSGIEKLVESGGR